MKQPGTSLLWVCVLIAVCSSTIHARTPKNSSMFDAIGVSGDSVRSRIEQIWKMMTEGDTAGKQRIYFEREDGSAYMLAHWKGRVLSPNQGMGMLAAVLLDDRARFDALWQFARENMYHTDGLWQGYFAFHTLPDGTMDEKKQKPWALGEVYIVTALIGAHKRWGSGKGIRNYRKEGEALLKHFATDTDTTSNGAIFHSELTYPLMQRRNGATKSVVSFHVPAFFRLWSKWSGDKAVRAFFAETEKASRDFLQKNATQGPYGLLPMFTTLDFGLEKNGDGHHDHFHPASHPAVLHIALDGICGIARPWQVQYADTLLHFFHSRGLKNWGYHYHIMSGEKVNEGEVSPDLAAATASLASLATVSYKKDFIAFAWDYPYDHTRGMIYLISMLAMSNGFSVLW